MPVSRARLIVGPIILMAALARGASAQTAAVPGAPPDSLTSVASLAGGRAIFHGAGQCLVCHGAKLEGSAMAPTLLTHKWKDAKDGTYAAILNVVQNGVPGTAMVAHPGGISDAQATQVAAYIWAAGHGVTKP
jgi:mono/diheme cytochrome c family protein